MVMGRELIELIEDEDHGVKSVKVIVCPEVMFSVDGRIEGELVR